MASRQGLIATNVLVVVFALVAGCGPDAKKVAHAIGLCQDRCIEKQTECKAKVCKTPIIGHQRGGVLEVPASSMECVGACDFMGWECGEACSQVGPGLR